MSPFRVVGVIGKRREPNLDLLRDLCDGLRRLGCEVLLEDNSAYGRDPPCKTVPRDELARHCELVIVVGGDGTLLDAGRDLAPAQVPLLGVNQGRLGFMVDVAPDSMHEYLA
ncbi:MAG: NAD(+)/NADH kinase, partial [Panacagrimonas sp.]